MLAVEGAELRAVREGFLLEFHCRQVEMEKSRTQASFSRSPHLGGVWNKIIFVKSRIVCLTCSLETYCP